MRLNQLQKKIIVGGQAITMYSYDNGLSWCQDNKNAQKRQRARIIAQTVFHPEKYAIQKTQDEMRKGLEGLRQFSDKEKILRPPERHSQSALGKAVGKQQKRRRNLRRKKERIIPKEDCRRFAGIGRVPVVHFHRCKACNFRFICM